MVIACPFCESVMLFPPASDKVPEETTVVVPLVLPFT